MLLFLPPTPHTQPTITKGPRCEEDFGFYSFDFMFLILARCFDLYFSLKKIKSNLDVKHSLIVILVLSRCSSC